MKVIPRLGVSYSNETKLGRLSAIISGTKQWRLRTVLRSLKTAKSANQNYDKKQTEPPGHLRLGGVIKHFWPEARMRKSWNTRKSNSHDVTAFEIRFRSPLVRFPFRFLFLFCVHDSFLKFTWTGAVSIVLTSSFLNSFWVRKRSWKKTKTKIMKWV